MQFRRLLIEGAWLVMSEPVSDARGSMTRLYCQQEFDKRGLHTDWVQHNLSVNASRGTLRGLHWQAEPFGEVKLVRCLRGAVFDVLVDLRPESSTYLRWQAIELSEGDGVAVYIPTGIAHGFQTLADDSHLLYHMGTFYQPDAAQGMIWNDPTLGIAWPIADPILSPRDAALPTLGPVSC